MTDYVGSSRQNSTAIGVWLVSVLAMFGGPVYAASAQEGPATIVAPYRIESAPKNLEELRARFSDEQIAILIRLNRADVTHLPRLDRITVPATWSNDPLSYTPFAISYAWGAQYSKLLVVDQQGQAFAAYERGRLVYWGPVSTGRQARQTPAGLFHLTWRSRGRHSTVDPDWYMEWYYNFENELGLSFHQYALPGRPASHACVRLVPQDARWLYAWGKGWTLDERGWSVLDPGTPVLILGCYAFDAPPLWQSLHWLATGVSLPAEPAVSQRPCGS